MPVIIVPNTIVNPGAVAVILSVPYLIKAGRSNSLVRLCDTAFASLAMLTPQWFTDHTVDTEMILVELPKLHELINDLL